MDVMKRLELSQKVMDKVFRETRRPVCRLELSELPFSLFDSHLGGVPYCPRDGVIPADPTGRQLWLCAQLNFSQLPKLAGFPDTGILQIFLSDYDYDGGFGLCSEADWTTQGSWRVVYYEDVDETVTLKEAEAKVQVDWSDKETWRIPGQPLKIECLAATEEGISRHDYRFDHVFAEAARELYPDIDPELLDLDRIFDDCDNSEHQQLCLGIEEKYSGNGCKIGGYLAYEQWDPRDECDAPEWDILLLQLDDRDKAPGFYLGGYGIANFFIRPEDLAKRDFSRVGGEWTTS